MILVRTISSLESMPSGVRYAAPERPIGAHIAGSDPPKNLYTIGIRGGGDPITAPYPIYGMAGDASGGTGAIRAIAGDMPHNPIVCRTCKVP